MKYKASNLIILHEHGKQAVREKTQFYFECLVNIAWGVVAKTK